jgi:hypothetical protein
LRAPPEPFCTGPQVEHRMRQRQEAACALAVFAGPPGFQRLFVAPGYTYCMPLRCVT